MSFQLRPVDPTRDETVTRVFDSAFAREERESSMARTLAIHPEFDAELSLVAMQADEAVGAAMFTRQQLRLHGLPISAAACAPIGVSPLVRGTGAGRALLDEGLARLRDLGCRCVTAIGAPEFFSKSGFGAAFDLYSQRVPIVVLAEYEAVEAAWRGLRAEDIPQLQELDSISWGAVDGSVVRSGSHLDWEAQARDSFALCSERGGQVRAYLRFRVRETVEVTDCCVRGPAEIQDVLFLLARLGREHSRDVVELRLPPNHPVARAAFRLGSPIEMADFGGASMLAVLDWPGLFADLSSELAPRLLRAKRPSLSLGIDGRDYRIEFRGGHFECNEGRDSVQHVDVPRGWAPGLITGRNSGLELAFETGEENPELVALLDAFFPRRTPTWAYGPIFELADD